MKPTIPATVLVVDDNRAILTAAELLLRSRFRRVVTTSTPERIRALVRNEAPDVVLLDMNFHAGINTGNEGLFWLSEIKKMHPAPAVVLFTAYADIELAVRGIKEGAADFVVKPWDNERLVNALAEACNRSTASATPAQPAPASTAMFWGTSPAMQHLRTLLEKVAPTDANVLITGENGTGKGVIARELHRLSARSHRPLVTVDMGAVAETLFESELFGHVRGAFTDARTDRPGKFEAADGGTLFLDEIGNLPLHLQAKLLAALQSRTVTRLGSNRPRPVDIRLLTATNRPLDELVARGDFRQDLLYRINTIRLTLPPLRARPDDILPLAERFLRRHADASGRPVPTLAEASQRKLLAYTWPGNIRELEHALEKAAILSDGPTIPPDAFDFAPAAPPLAADPPTTIEEMEADLIRRTIKSHAGNLSLTASTLGISRQTLYNKIKRYGI